MRIVDANVLLYAVNSAAEHHDSSRRWLDGALSGGDVVGFAWVPLLAFARLATKRGLFPSPMHPQDAMAQIRDWCAAPNAMIVNPTARHADVLSNLLVEVGTGGNLVNDAHLAALAIEHRASVVTYDRDFGRFDGVRWDAPAALLA
ncbi:type II toxin-antitoxin system VapC family toxin [Mycolicibacterium hodleri]|uniref:Ribonuclease VapC n=1 Tax=Mycolicibacterium hodleri TaxID=49897 RepID=A0A502EB08_9MYCO|nr:type II toxin-antitoxin system VapC family toxin [Mycolicibacterium hodleri]TPG34159.1 type II toxin-antitoxin system VapC family toxin [Mycolicibacterium hodleri]